MAYNNLIQLPFDCWFFGIQRGANHTSLDFKFVDLDNVEKMPEEGIGKLFKSNLDDFMENAEAFLKNFVSDSYRQKYLDELHSFDFGN